MKKFITTIAIILLFSPQLTIAKQKIAKPLDFSISGNNEMSFLSWKNPKDGLFSKVILFRSTIPIESYFSYGAIEGLCDKIYIGTDESFIDTGLIANISYYYIIFASDENNRYSKANVIERKLIDFDKIVEYTSPNVIDTENENKLIEATAKTVNEVPKEIPTTLVGASPAIVNEVSVSEANHVFSYNNNSKIVFDDSSQRLALLIIVQSPHSLNENDKNAISYFIQEGTPTTIVLGKGERTGVLNSYLSAFDKLPRSVLEWQDIIKIANGRWPEEKNLESEEKASDQFFSAIYERKPNISDPNDNAAITIIAYGLRPANRNLESEKNAINIYRAIFGKSPTEAVDWDLVRAIAYSGAVR